MPTMSEEASGSALAAERAAGAAESAAEAAGRAAGAMENMGEWMARLASQSGLPALAGAEAVEMQARIGKGGPGVIKRGVIAIGQRVSELSDGRYGLSVQPEEKALRKSTEKHLAREASTEAKAAWFPWMLGLSLGLVIGMIGVAYWQRRRLQRFWGQTSQRAQHATEGLRQRLEASRSARPPGAPSEAAMGRVPEPVDYTPPGSPRADMTIDQQVNGRVESASQ